MSLETSVSATPVLVGVGEGAAGELRVGEPADRALDDAGAVVASRRATPIAKLSPGTTKVSQTRSGITWQFGQMPGLAEPVVGLGDRLGGAVGAVAVGRAAARGVEGVVVVVEEVPAGDVVDVAVGVVVAAVGEGRDQVGGVEDLVGLAVARRDRDPRVAGVVADVEGAVVVGVVGP